MIALLLSSLCLAAPADAALDLALGGSAPGVAAARLQAGSTWTGASAQYGLPRGWTVRADYLTATFARHQPAVGVGRRWVDQRWRVSGEAMLGWVVQPGTLATSGPTGELRVRAGRVGTVAPVFRLGAQGILPLERTTTVSASGERSSLAAETGLTLTGGFGAAVQLGGRWAAEVGVDMDWVDVPTISIPGAHLALTRAGGIR